MKKNSMGVICNDPLSVLPIGESLKFKLLSFRGSDANDIPTWVKNWGFFKGAVAAFMLKSIETQNIIGSAVIIAPGLAITATHNFIDELPVIQKGKIQPYCLGIRDAQMDIWKVSNITYSDDSDIAFLSLVAASNIPEDKCYYRLGITTRTPKIGETLHIMGFRGSNVGKKNLAQFDYSANLYTAQGEVTNIYPTGRDKLLLPYPSIQISCGSVGSMSGGAVLDQNGLVVGIVSRGLETEDKKGPTFVAWIIKALHQPIKLLGVFTSLD